MNKLHRFVKKITRRKQDTHWHTTMPNEILRLQATHNYGVSLFHLGQDWAYDRAVETFLKIINVIAPADHTAFLELKYLAQGSLACTYAKLAARRPLQKKQYSDLTFNQTRIMLENASINKETKALAFTANGLAHLSLGRYDQAIDAFKCASELDDNIIALLGMGEAYWKAGNRDNAMEAYQKANKMTSTGGYAAYKIGNLFREINNKDLAIEAYKRASALSVARLALGKIYLEDDELEAALEEFRNAVNINRKNSEALVNIAWTILEMQNADEDLLKECVDAARRSLQIDMGSTNEWHRRAILALSLIAGQKPEQALREAKLSFDLAPDKAQTKFCVALCEFHLGRADNAMKILLDILHSEERGLWRTKAESLMRNMKRDMKKAE